MKISFDFFSFIYFKRKLDESQYKRRWIPHLNRAPRTACSLSAIIRLPGESLDVFEIHRDILDDYKQFVRSFIKIRDKAIKHEVDKGIADGKFWPEPLIGFNPSFEKGFCDGTPHYNPETQEMDKKRREAIRNRGGQVLVWNYRERLEDFIAGRPDIFKKTF